MHALRIDIEGPSYRQHVATSAPRAATQTNRNRPGAATPGADVSPDAGEDRRTEPHRGRIGFAASQVASPSSPTSSSTKASSRRSATPSARSTSSLSSPATATGQLLRSDRICTATRAHAGRLSRRPRPPHRHGPHCLRRHSISDPVTAAGGPLRRRYAPWLLRTTSKTRPCDDPAHPPIVLRPAPLTAAPAPRSNTIHPIQRKGSRRTGLHRIGSRRIRIHIRPTGSRSRRDAAAPVDPRRRHEWISPKAPPKATRLHKWWAVRDRALRCVRPRMRP